MYTYITVRHTFKKGSLLDTAFVYMKLGDVTIVDNSVLLFNTGLKTVKKHFQISP